MTDRDEYIAERAAVIHEGNTTRRANGEWISHINIDEARQMAANEWDAMRKAFDEVMANG